VSSEAVRVYAVLALSVYQGRTSRVGMRQIGKIIGKCAATVKKRIDELVAAGHVRANMGRSGQRAFYELTSPVFGQKHGKVTEVGVGPSGGRRLVSIAVEDVA
jgi:hypothetical protein